MTRPFNKRGVPGGRRADDVTPVGDPLLDRFPDDTRFVDETSNQPSPAPIGERGDAVGTDDREGAGGPTGAPVDDTEEGNTVARRRRRRALIDWVIVVGVALLVAFLVRTFVLAHFVVDGTSMADTLEHNDRVFVNKLSYRLHDPNRGDVVVLHQLNGTSERDLIKRVIALPGETIRIEQCVVYINDQPLEEPYLNQEAMDPDDCGPDEPATPIPEDHVYVMGDNRGGSQDSRAIGPIPEDELVGRAFVVFWPTDNWQWL